MRLKRLAGQFHPIVHPSLADHQEHVTEDRVGILFLGEIDRHLPEVLWLHPELGDVAVLLHVAGAERPVEVVANGDRAVHGMMFCDVCIRHNSFALAVLR